MHTISTTIRRPRRIIALFLATIITIIAAASPATAQEISEEQRAALYARPAIVYLEHHWEVWVDHDQGRLPLEFTGSCTGFVVEENGYIITAGHCVDPGPNGSGIPIIRAAVDLLWNDYAGQFSSFDDMVVYGLTNWTIEGLIAGSEATPETLVYQAAAISGLRTADAWPARIVEFQPGGSGDVALLKTEQRKLSTIQLRDAREVNVGLPVLSIGYPGSVSRVTDFNFEPTFKNGQISSAKTVDSFPVFEISAAVSQGMSGGPTIDLGGRVVGVNSFGPARESQPFNFVSSVDLVNEMLNRNGVNPGPGPVDASYRAGVDAYLAGDHATAIDRFDEVLDRSPSHSQSMELRTLAQDALAAQGTSNGNSTVVVVAAIAIALLGLALVAQRKGALRLPVHGGGPAPAVAPAASPVPAPAPAPSATETSGSTGWWTELPTTPRVDA